VRIVAAETGDHDFLLIGAVVAVGVLQEQNVRRVRHPHAAMTDRDSRRNVQAFGKDGDFVDAAVVIGIFQDLNAVAPGPRFAARVFEAFRDPNTAAFVEGHRDRIHQVGLGGHDFHGEARWHRHLGDRFLGRQRRPRGRVLIVRNRSVALRGLRRNLTGDDQGEQSNPAKEEHDRRSMAEKWDALTRRERLFCVKFAPVAT